MQIKQFLMHYKYQVGSNLKISEDKMVPLQLLLLFPLLVDAYVIYQQDLGLVPLVPVNPYAIAQRNDLINKLSQFFTCPLCCEDLKEPNEDFETKIEEVVYEPADEELAVLNVIPLATTEQTTVGDGEQLQRNNAIVKEFLDVGKTVKKEEAGNNSTDAVALR